MNQITKNGQAGFTLIEIAIVLVIIGLLLGGVLKGQEMITQGKIKNIISDFNGVQAAYYGYQDRYKAIPGDDVGAAARWAGATSGGGNGALAGAYNAAPATAVESNLFWQHLRFAGFIPGPASGVVGGTQPTNAVTGMLGVETGDGPPPTGTVGLGLTGLIICSANLPGKIATAVDSQLDDGIATTGQVRGKAITVPNAATGVAGTVNYVDDGTTIYVVCKSL